ncbi:NADH-cytochrome b5 reductase [Chloropicon primus]|uniref:NADH-cytochrome b5 reductase n=1 Tax=Chloropicon primus TaxID=1764295 RepID=A0A5B8MRB1_9CHLO|nr:NADH-cytochrome b5 reductase [Chloropicon primus]UPR01003.1 NADH-cytochrome b5 reductase [Chloropicon primus]|eukprot:QDZ21782.1 NADH-cytochrome b5 reductase [Chloropicon primus]
MFARKSLMYLGGAAIGGALGVRLGSHMLGDKADGMRLATFKTAEADSTKSKHGGMQKDAWVPFTLSERTKVTGNTHLYRFKLDDAEDSINLPIASCLLVRARIGEKQEDGNNKFVIRPYTPTSASTTKGYFDLVVKVYEKGVMSKHFGNLKTGDSLEIKGPIVKLPYAANMKKHIGMVAGGTGITPMLQVAEAILSNPEDKTKVSLIFGNVTEKDIILRKELDEYAKKHPDRFEVFYVLDKPGFFWKGGKGYITKEMLQQRMPAPSNENMVFVCGPPPMMNVISGNKAPDKSQGELKGLLKDLGYTSDQVFKF